MSALSSQADFYRILSHEAEAGDRHSFVPTAPNAVSDAAFLEHVGTHFPSGPSKGPPANYPNSVEISEDEAAAPQPGANELCTPPARRLQHSHYGRRQKYSPATPTPNLPKDGLCISREAFSELSHYHFNKRRHSDRSDGSQKYDRSTTISTQKASSIADSSYSEQLRVTSTSALRSYTPAPSARFSKSHTPSQCSAMTDGDDVHKDGIGPSPPHPYSEWDPYSSQHAEGWTDGNPLVYEDVIQGQRSL